jgi:hypothetical protein
MITNFKDNALQAIVIMFLDMAGFQSCGIWLSKPMNVKNRKYIFIMHGQYNFSSLRF